MTDPNGFATTYLYDSMGRLAGESRPVRYWNGFMYFTMEVPVGTFTYDLNSNLLTATDGNGHATNYTYNALNEQTSVTDADGQYLGHLRWQRQRLVRDRRPWPYHELHLRPHGPRCSPRPSPPAAGRRVTLRRGRRLVSVTDPVGNITRYSYTAAHEVATTPSRRAESNVHVRRRGQLTQSVDPDGHVIDYSYNADNQLTTETWVNPYGGTSTSSPTRTTPTAS